MNLTIEISENAYQFVMNTSFIEDERSIFTQTKEDRKKTMILFDILNAIRNGTPLSDWLNSFDTNSATKCFEAVNILKMKTAQEEMHEADERLLNSNWGDMEVRE